MRPGHVSLFRQTSPLLLSPTSPSLLKLLALPLTRLPTKAHSPSFLLQAKRTPVTTTTRTEDGKEKVEATKQRDLPYLTRATVWASTTWENLGKADEGSWKRKAYATGTRFMDRIEFEEWALKAIDPALSPKPWSAIKEGKDGLEARRKADEVTLVYPSSLLEEKDLVASLKQQLDHRQPLHKKAMYRCLLFAPVTLPFAIVPIVPNFPLFYVLWRAWSHYRAWKASQYLSNLLSSSQIAVTPSTELDKIYSSVNASSPVAGSAANESVLGLDKVPEIVRAFKLSEEESAELTRAVKQSEKRLQELTEKKQE